MPLCLAVIGIQTREIAVQVRDRNLYNTNRLKNVYSIILLVQIRQWKRWTSCSTQWFRQAIHDGKGTPSRTSPPSTSTKTRPTRREVRGGRPCVWFGGAQSKCSARKVRHNKQFIRGSRYTAKLTREFRIDYISFYEKGKFSCLTSVSAHAIYCIWSELYWTDSRK